MSTPIATTLPAPIKVKRRKNNITNTNTSTDISSTCSSVGDKNIIIPLFSDYLTFPKQGNTFTLPELKELCKLFRLHRTGVKPILIGRIADHLKRSWFALIIQRVWRKFAYRVYVRSRGPALLKRNLCVNETDFYSFDLVKDIPFNQFYSYREVGTKDVGAVYGFDIQSLHHWLNMGDIHASTNPYNRQEFPPHVKQDMTRLVTFSNIFKEPIFILDKTTTTTTTTGSSLASSTSTSTLIRGLHDDEPPPTPNTVLYERIIELFREIDNLGNYSDPRWFMSLDGHELCRYIRHLHDIWHYRANLSPAVMREICPNGELFSHIDMSELYRLRIFHVRQLAIQTMELLVTSGINRDVRALGTNYVLCALTLVNYDASVALPWLYQSVV
jgi:hypothetical protein